MGREKEGGQEGAQGHTSKHENTRCTHRHRWTHRHCPATDESRDTDTSTSHVHVLANRQMPPATCTRDARRNGARHTADVQTKSDARTAAERGTRTHWDTRTHVWTDRHTHFLAETGTSAETLTEVCTDGQHGALCSIYIHIGIMTTPPPRRKPRAPHLRHPWLQNPSTRALLGK